MPGQPPHCVEDQQAQYCECYVEWSQSDCQADPNTSWDAMHHECMYNMDEYACYHGEDIMLGPAEGNIDCSEYMHENIDQYTEWVESEGVCELIFQDALDGSWSIDGNSLCLDTEYDEFEETACGSLYFEACKCNSHRCNWTPQPTFNNPDAGLCAEGSQDPGQGGGRVRDTVQGVEHYKIKTVSSLFQNELINNMFFNNPPDCYTFELQDNGDVHVTETNEVGTCTVILKPVGDDS